uniref:Uncharacterized protein n=1 Tax=Arundo donax TaxID=35708 RepID=A0A0A9B903_ARUDO
MGANPCALDASTAGRLSLGVYNGFFMAIDTCS